LVKLTHMSQTDSWR